MRLHTCSICNNAEAPSGHRRIHCPRNNNPPQAGVRQQPQGKGAGKGKGNKGKGAGKGKDKRN